MTHCSASFEDMYNPLRPNIYTHTKIKLARLDLLKKETPDNTLPPQERKSTNFLSDALLSVSAPASLLDAQQSTENTADVTTPAPLGEDPELIPVAPLNASAEELHRMRISRSAALGVKRAVELQREEIEVEHKRQRLEGKDARSRIASLLGKMRESAVKTESEKEGSSALGTVMRQSSTTSSGSAPLVFKSAGLAAGGYVMVPTTPGEGGRKSQNANSSNVRGKPSNTLLLKYARDPPVVMASSDLERDCALCCEEARAACGTYGTVRGVRWYVLTTAEEEWLVKTRVLSPTQLACERLRIFVRFDTVADAFRAAERLSDGGNQGRWSVSFFPSTLYNNGALGLGEDLQNHANET